MTAVSYVTNNRGRSTAVLISLKKWDEIYRAYGTLLKTGLLATD